jgi:uncharacterized protein YciW
MLAAMLIFAVAESTVFGIAAAISSLIGVGLSIAAYRSKREQETSKLNEEQHKQLLEARAEAERLSQELHDLKMKMGSSDATSK